MSERPESPRSRQRRQLYRVLGTPETRVQVSRLVVLLLMLAILVGFLVYALLRPTSHQPATQTTPTGPVGTTVPATGHPTS